MLKQRRGGFASFEEISEYEKNDIYKLKKKETELVVAAVGELVELEQSVLAKDVGLTIVSSGRFHQGREGFLEEDEWILYCRGIKKFL